MNENIYEFIGKGAIAIIGLLCIVLFLSLAKYLVKCIYWSVSLVWWHYKVRTKYLNFFTLLKMICSVFCSALWMFLYHGPDEDRYNFQALLGSYYWNSPKENFYPNDKATLKYFQEKYNKEKGHD